MQTVREQTSISMRVYKEVVKRDNHHCVVCGKIRRLHCHHVIHRSEMGKGVPENLVMLCEECHYNIHNNPRLMNNLNEYVMAYLKHHYKDWSKDKVTFKKGEEYE